MALALEFRGREKMYDCEAPTVVFGMRSHGKELNDASLSMQDQPATLCAVEGEIYNQPGLIQGMGRKDEFRNAAGLLSRLYETYGADFCRGCNGVFTAAIYDSDKNKLLLVRDHMGSHSLYYAMIQGAIIFASTIDAILASELVQPQLNPEAMNLYFSGTCVPHPHTLFRGIKCVPPGHVVVFRKGRDKPYDYWKLQEISEDFKTGEAEFIARITDLVDDAIKIRLHGDASFGCVLSGGVDSSTITATIKRWAKNSIPTFAIGYHEMEYDDTPLQEVMYRNFNLRERNARISPREIPDLLAAVVQNCDVPVNNASAMGTYRCFQLASHSVRAIFDGEAADELFCGGGGVVGEHLVEQFEVIPLSLRRLLFSALGSDLAVDMPGRKAKLRRFFHRLTLPGCDRMLQWLPAFDFKARLKLFQSDFHSMIREHDVLAEGRSYLNASRLKDKINLYQYGACKTYLCNDLLYKNERMAAANGLVNRTPFIDYRLAELAFRIPARYKLQGIRSSRVEKKLIYRKALQGVIPDQILWRRKARGFSQPTSEWMRGPLREFVNDVILGRRTRDRGILNMNYVQKLLDLHLSGAADLDRLLWGILTFELWLRYHYDGATTHH